MRVGTHSRAILHTPTLFDWIEVWRELWEEDGTNVVLCMEKGGHIYEVRLIE